MMKCTQRFSPLLLTAVAVLALPVSQAAAWGDEGHETIALIAQHYLNTQARAAVAAMLLQDTANTLTAHDIASEATWADKYRASSAAARGATADWHFADIELATGDVQTACFNFPAIPAGEPASSGPPKDCVVDKIAEFAAELNAPTVPAAEKLTALKFVLHFVGDVHQPLHSADDNDRGGNDKPIAGKYGAAKELHAFWDTTVVERLGADAPSIAAKLIADITPQQVTDWSAGTPRDWALEAFKLAKADAYGKLPAPRTGIYVLTDAYVTKADSVAAEQLSRAGVRLAAILNQRLGASGP